jgi:hypothetical protein
MSLQIVKSQSAPGTVIAENQKRRPAVYGILFTKAEADQLFGPILQSVPMATESLKKYSELTKDHLMYNIKQDKVFLLNNKRIPITPEGISVPRAEVYKVCAMSVLKDLLHFGKEDMTYFEKRESTLTITCGGFTLEMAANCPPICP